MSLKVVSSNTVLSLNPDDGTYEVIDVRYLPRVAECIAMVAADEEGVITVHIGGHARTVCPSCGVDKITAMLKGADEELLRVVPDGSYDADKRGCIHTIAEQALDVASRLRLAMKVVVNYSGGFTMITAGQDLDDAIRSLSRLRLTRCQLSMVA